MFKDLFIYCIFNSVVAPHPTLLCYGKQSWLFIYLINLYWSEQQSLEQHSIRTGYSESVFQMVVLFS